MKPEDTIKILYSDENLAVAVKPCGMLSQADITGDAAMPELLSARLKRKVYPVHRLDRAAGGLMVFACSAHAAGVLSRSLREGSFVKEYLTIVHGSPEGAAGKYRDFLSHDSLRNRTVSEGKACTDLRAKPAALSYEILDKAEGEEIFSLLKISLETGRTHQIRVQLSSRGMPIAGDGKYGAHDKCGLALWSYRLAFPHPKTGKPLAFFCLPEQSWPWSLFSFGALTKDGSNAVLCGGRDYI